MRPLLVFLFATTAFSVSAQKEKIPATDYFVIEGRVKQTMNVTIADLLSYKTHFIDSIVITNHL